MNTSGARILTCTMEEYFADPCSRPSLSQSLAKTLVTRSPLHAWQEHPRLGGTPHGHTRSTDRGSILGAMILGTTSEVVELVRGFDDFRKDDAKALRDSARARGLVPILEREHDELTLAAKKIEVRFAELGIFFDGVSEVKLEWEEDTAEGPVLCRGMLDHFKQARGTVWDLKSIVNAHPDFCQKRLDEFGYDIQHAAYTSAARWLGIPSPTLGFLFFETEPPYAVNPIRPSASLIDLGERRWTRAVRTWERCLRENTWPGYATGWNTVAARSWALQRELEVEAA